MNFENLNLENWPLLLRDWIVGFCPDWSAPFVNGLLVVVAILTVFGLGFAFLTVTERKLIGRFQNRLGPNRTGPFGLMQPFADAIKALTKEDIVPDRADKVLHFLAPVVVVFCALLTLAAVPYGKLLVPLNLDAGLVYFFAAGAMTELAIFMAGWSSHNKFSLLSGMRALAQLISYELPLLLATVPVVVAAGTLSLQGIAEAQGGIFGWNVFTPWGVAAFVIFFISSIAEANRSPFDLPEGESEIIAGHLTEYSGFKYALFFMGEYFGLLALSGVGVTLFWGGWQAPCKALEVVPSYVWFGLKLCGFLFSFIWIRATFLRLRIDQLMRFSWKFLLPLCLINLLSVTFWELTSGWSGAPALVGRWVIGFLIVVIPFVLLGRRLSRGLGARVYRYAP